MGILQHVTHTNTKDYFVIQKLGLNTDLKDFWCTDTNKTQIWFGEFNHYAFKAKNAQIWVYNIFFNPIYLVVNDTLCILYNNKKNGVRANDKLTEFRKRWPMIPR